MDTFRPFSMTHLLVVVSFVATTIALVWLRRRWRDSSRARALDLWLVLATAAVAIAATVWPMLPGNFRHDWAWPLHVCDLTAIAVPLALLTGRRWLRSIGYFWGVGLSTQSFITPDLQDGPGRVGFWIFWATHFSVVGVPLYDVIARGYRPRWRDFAVVYGIGLGYAGAMFALDAATGWNYGYVGPTSPERPTLVDALGPWPLRVVWIVLLAGAAMALLVVPWEIARAGRQRSEPAPAPGGRPQLG